MISFSETFETGFTKAVVILCRPHLCILFQLHSIEEALIHTKKW